MNLPIVKTPNAGNKQLLLPDHITLIAGIGPDGSAQILQANSSGVLAASAPSAYRNAALNSTKASVFIGATNLYGYNFINQNAYPVYVKLYDALVASVTVGTTPPARVLAVPANGVLALENNGQSQAAFAIGVVIAVTKNLADNDTTALDAALYTEVLTK